MIHIHDTYHNGENTLQPRPETIRKAKTNDLGAINEIYNHAIKHGGQTAQDEFYSLAQTKEWLGKFDPNKHPVFVIEKDGKVVGWASLSEYRSGRDALKRVAEISYYFHQDFQGQGLGSQLMEFAISEAPKYHFNNLIAILLDGNIASVKLLKNFGFDQWGRMPKTAFINGEYIDHLYYGLKI
jgi:L-amino acid N-acyltransferase YncA